MPDEVLTRVERLEAAILGRDGLVAQVAAIRAILERLEGVDARRACAIDAMVPRAECDRRHAEMSAWTRAIVPALVGAGLALIVSLLTRGI